MRAAGTFVLTEDDKDQCYRTAFRLASILKRRGITGVLLEVRPTAGVYGIYAHGHAVQDTGAAGKMLATIASRYA